MITTQLFCKALKFAAHAAGKKDNRYYLCGVRLEWDMDRLDVVGCDGARLAWVSLRTHSPSATPLAITLGHADVKNILASMGKDKGDLTLVVETPADPATPSKATLTAGGVTLNCTGLGGIYPQWRRVIPGQRLNHELPRMDVHLLADMLADMLAAIAPFCGKVAKGAAPVAVTAGPEAKSTAVTFRPGAVHEPEILGVLGVIQSLNKE